MSAWRSFPILTLTVLLVLLVLAMPGIVEAQTRPAAPAGEMTWGVHVSLAPIWFDPAEHTGIITVMMVLYAVHDALVKPMPGNPLAPSLAESWTMSKDGLVYEFVVRKGVVFHNGDALTADDVKFSFERYRGAAANSANRGQRLGAITADTRNARANTGAIRILSTAAADHACAIEPGPAPCAAR